MQDLVHAVKQAVRNNFLRPTDWRRGRLQDTWFSLQLFAFKQHNFKTKDTYKIVNEIILSEVFVR